MNVPKINAEKEMLDFLGKCGELPIVLLKSILPNIPNSLFDECLIDLSQKKAILPLNSKSYTLKTHKMATYKEKLVQALWVYSNFASQTESRNTGILEYPEQFFFIKKDKNGKYVEYDISVFNKGDDMFVTKLDFNRNVKHIIIVPSEDSLELYQKRLSNIENVSFEKVLFATVIKNGKTIEPDVEFYSPSVES